MGDQTTPTASMWSASWSRETVCGFDTFPTPFRFRIRLEFGTRLSYFIRVSNRPLFRYDYAAWPERTTTNREDERNMAVSTLQDDKKKALNLAIAQIEKSCGKGSIMRLGADQKVRVEAISTGAINLDAAIGVGGIPRGRITEIYGPESSGKTTLCLHVVANAQRNGGVAAYIDAEHALDTEYARKLGVDVEALLISQPDTGEPALEICEILVRSGAVDVVVIDSVAALVPKAEIEGDMGDSHVGLQARLMSQALRKLTGSIARSKTSVVFINQLREKI